MWKGVHMKKTKSIFHRIKAAVACILITALFCSGCQNTSKPETENSKKLPQIVVGSDNYPPFSYEDANGRPTGIDVDLATEAFQRMGYQAVIQFINWENKNELLESGKLDCIWCSFSIDGREDQYRWSSPYMISRQVVAVNRGSNIYTLADLKGKRVAVQSTTMPEEMFRERKDKRIPKLKDLFSLQNRELLYPFLSKGYADAIAAHETAIRQCMKDYNLEYRILEEPLQTVGLGVAFSKQDDRGLEKKLSETFQDMKKDGTLKQIIGKYLDNPESYLKEDANEK